MTMPPVPPSLGAYLRELREARPRSLDVTIGNAGGIELTLNGRPMPPLGERGVVIRRLELPSQAMPAAGS